MVALDHAQVQEKSTPLDLLVVPFFAPPTAAGGAAANPTAQASALRQAIPASVTGPARAIVDAVIDELLPVGKAGFRYVARLPPPVAVGEDSGLIVKHLAIVGLGSSNPTTGAFDLGAHVTSLAKEVEFFTCSRASVPSRPVWPSNICAFCVIVVVAALSRGLCSLVRVNSHGFDSPPICASNVRPSRSTRASCCQWRPQA